MSDGCNNVKATKDTCVCETHSENLHFRFPNSLRYPRVTERIDRKSSMTPDP